MKKGDGIVRGMRGIDLEHIGREAEGIFGGKILFLFQIYFVIIIKEIDYNKEMQFCEKKNWF